MTMSASHRCNKTYARQQWMWMRWLADWLSSNASVVLFIHKSLNDFSKQFNDSILFQFLLLCTLLCCCRCSRCDKMCVCLIFFICNILIDFFFFTTIFVPSPFLVLLLLLLLLSFFVVSICFVHKRHIQTKAPFSTWIHFSDRDIPVYQIKRTSYAITISFSLSLLERLLLLYRFYWWFWKQTWCRKYSRNFK